MLEWMFVGTLGGLGAVVLMGLEALNCLLTCLAKRRTRFLYAAAGRVLHGAFQPERNRRIG